MTIVSYCFYFRDLWSGRTKPHAITWLIWTTLTAIAFGAQVSDHAGPGSWVLGANAAFSVVIFAASLKRGERHITTGDWACLVGAALAGALWAITDNALLAVILVTVIDALGFAPTFRKSFSRPGEETLSTYAISVLKLLISLVALDNFSAITALYPASLVVMNGVFVAMLVIRRRQLSADIGV